MNCAALWEDPGWSPSLRVPRAAAGYRPVAAITSKAKCRVLSPLKVYI